MKEKRSNLIGNMAEIYRKDQMKTLHRVQSEVNGFKLEHGMLFNLNQCWYIVSAANPGISNFYLVDLKRLIK